MYMNEDISTEVGPNSSILNLTKKRLGILPDTKEFDQDILMCINASISILRQIGVGPQDIVFFVNDDTQTYADYLGEDSNEIPLVMEYLSQKAKLMFDPPQSSIVSEAIKSMIKETECRLQYQVDPVTTFE